MQNRQIRKKGVRVGKNESAMDALVGSVPHWIHHKVDSLKSYLSKLKSDLYLSEAKKFTKCKVLII